MAIRNRFIFVPLCLCLFSASSFSLNRSVDISGYARSVRNFIIAKGDGVFEKYKGKGCAVRFHIYRDGTFSFNIVAGSPDLCNQLSGVLGGVKKIPLPPSEDIYFKMQDVIMDFIL